ncbi:MAG: cytochrome c-type biogenesis protein [Betaproteobacteria bacterium]|jgi:cytochrome c-type biogenesis protein CcmH
MNFPSILLSLLLFAHSPFLASEEARPLADDPVLEERVKAISYELRCLVCQNQTIADSNAGLAIDLRNQVRDMLKRGMSDTDIREFMVARYGDFVLYNPPVKNTTVLLWLGPLLMLVIAGVLAIRVIRSRSKSSASQDLADADINRARVMLSESDEKRS